MKKQIITILLTLSLVFVIFTACDPDAPNTETPNTEIPNTEDQEPDGSEETSDISVSGISITETSINLKLGTSTQITVTITPANATDKSVTFESSNPAIATVNESGLVFGLAEGNTSITVTTTDGGFSAASGVTVYSPEWKTTEAIDNAEGDARTPQICFDAEGNAIAVWSQSIGFYGHIWANSYSPDTGWGEAALIEAQSRPSSNFQITSNSSGTVFAVWQQDNGSYYDLMACRYTPDNGWETEVYIEESDVSCLYPQIACDPQGNAAAVWRQNGSRYDNIWACFYTTGNGWGTPEKIENDDTGTATGAKIVFDSDNTPVAVWQQQNSSYDTYLWMNRLIEGEWGTPEKVDTNEGFEPRIACDGNGNIFTTWYNWSPSTPSIFSNMYNSSSGWAGTELIGGETDDSRAPELAVNSDGTAFVVWYSNDGTEENAWGNCYTPGEGWANETLLETTAGSVNFPRIACDSSGNAAAFWNQYDGTKYDIWVNYYNSRTGWTTAELLETEDGTASGINVAFDNEGNAFAVWAQTDGNGESNIYARRFE